MPNKPGSVRGQYAVKDTKLCRGCGVEKLRSEFYARAGLFTTAGRPVLHAQCKECHIAKVMAHPSMSPEAKRARNLMANYGITPEQYDELLVQQGGKCAICPRTEDSQERRLHVDHDHATGRVRGLLCDQCNRAIGLLADNPDRMRKAAAYVEAGE